MSADTRDRIALRAWSKDDLGLLERLLGDPALMTDLGGPEIPGAILSRHERYLGSDPSRTGLFAIIAGPAQIAVGWVGYWESTWGGQDVWECGWHVLLEHQGHGVATRATALAIERVRNQAAHRYLHAFPSVGNVASNALCATLGFTLLGEVEVEYPVGQMMQSNNWRLDLTLPRPDNEAVEHRTGK